MSKSKRPWALLLALSCLATPAVAWAGKRDRDSDRLPDRWEHKHHLSVTKKSAKGDPDHDRLSNLREFRLRTNPRKADTDGDGLKDRAEVRRYHTNPRRRDTDGDGYNDRVEIRAHTNPRNRHSHPRKPAEPTALPPAPATPPPAPTLGSVGPQLGSQPACTRSAGPGTFDGQLSAASAGDVICLSSGNYGDFEGTNKAVTIRNAAGAAAKLSSISFTSGDSGFTLDGLTIDGGRIADGSRNITIRNSAFTSPLTINGVLNGNILLDHDSWLNINGDGGPPARIHLSYGCNGVSGVTVSNSLLAGGDSDGVQAGCAVSILYNEFRDISQHGSNHTDNIQLVGTNGTVIRGNWVHSTSPSTTQGITAYDGVAHADIEDNVVDIRRAWGIELYADVGSIVRHNTLAYHPPGCYGGAPCGLITVDHKSGDPAGRGTIVTDNVATDITAEDGSQIAERHNNLVRQGGGAGDRSGAPRFMGGGGYGGFRLASGSPGKGGATDGSDIGIH
jgi:Bacterial TSP3 repeat